MNTRVLTYSESLVAVRSTEFVMKSVPINFAETARRIGSSAGCAPASENLDLLGGGLRDVYAQVGAPMPETLLALARRVEARVSGAGEAA